MSAETFKLREQVLRKYGGRCTCPCGCQDGNLRHLQFDHLHDGSGNQERTTVRGNKLYLKLYAEVVDPQYRLLCANCHWQRGMDGGCQDVHVGKDKDLTCTLQTDTGGNGLPGHTPAVPSAPIPWMDPAQWDAWRVFKAQWDADQRLTKHPAEAAPMPTPSKRWRLPWRAS